MDFFCPCDSKKPYEKCCQPFHRGASQPKTALELMRSRYSAYAMNEKEYIILTTHPKSPLYEPDLPAWAASITEFSTNTSFDGLEIIDTQEEKEKATVTFLAKLSRNAQDVSFQEKSTFVKEKGLWTYFSAEF